jgi:enoyl-CoA hydratase
MNYQTLLTKTRGQHLLITINRPDKMNALNKMVIAELDDVFTTVYESDEIRGVILTGSGEKAFVAGADISEFASFTVSQAKELTRHGHRIFDKIENCTKPVIAAVNGFALGGGCELAMACHMRLASENARFGQPEINLGIIPGYGGTQRLPRYIGKARAMELLLTGDMITADQALQMGLINAIYKAEELLEKSFGLLERINSKSPLVIDQIIACVNAYYQKDENGFELEMDEFSRCMATEDFKEGTKAFLEKRKPQFTGR